MLLIRFFLLLFFSSFLFFHFLPALLHGSTAAGCSANSFETMRAFIGSTIRAVANVGGSAMFRSRIMVMVVLATGRHESSTPPKAVILGAELASTASAEALAQQAEGLLFQGAAEADGEPTLA